MFPHPQTPLFQFSSYSTRDSQLQGKISVSLCTSATCSVQTDALIGLGRSLARLCFAGANYSTRSMKVDHIWPNFHKDEEVQGLLHFTEFSHS